MQELPFFTPVDGLVNAIEAAGHVIYNRGGVWYGNDAEAIASIAASYEPIPQNLTATQMRWLLAFTGLGRVWDEVGSWLEQFDRAAYADLDMHKANDVFRYPATLSVVSQFRELAQWLVPDVDLSDETIRAAWLLALEK